jgi:ribonuclease E
MTDPLDTNDDWAELARELERDKPPAKPAGFAEGTAPPADMVERRIEAEAVEPHHGDPRAEEDAIGAGEPEGGADEEFDDADDAAPVEAGEPTAEGEQPGTGRKRRRRRRRRRKGGAPAEGTAPAGTAPVDSSEDEGEAELVGEVEDEPEADFDAPEEMDTEPVTSSVEEDTASEVLRDLIANWNVPSWDDIVSGLYRPG